MRRFLVFVSLALLPALLPADEKKDDEKALPNTLTKKEISKGWLLLFDGETMFGWKIDGEAKVEKGVLILGGEKETKAETTVWLPPEDLEFQTAWEGKQPPRITAPGITLTLIDSDKDRFSRQSFGVSSSDTARAPVVRFTVPAGSKLRLRDVKLRPDCWRALFNGKDLKGWKPYKGDEKREKSKFTVTKEGWLNVKNGPGDLQTEKKFDDFVLRLECISNGKHLNSGIFFRALPGEYQQGYEAQIRNQFKEKPTEKYVVEEYDPKTNKPTGKKTIMATAVDYGTGAIYRRVPARKQVSKDGEWFTLTVVARERHFATWVNGIQQVDWTDNRPADKSARKGYRADAGCISIQGHDPTTDLSFRNLRIMPLDRPKKKD